MALDNFLTKYGPEVTKVVVEVAKSKAAAALIDEAATGAGSMVKKYITTAVTPKRAEHKRRPRKLSSRKFNALQEEKQRDLERDWRKREERVESPSPSQRRGSLERRGEYRQQPFTPKPHPTPSSNPRSTQRYPFRSRGRENPPPFRQPPPPTPAPSNPTNEQGRRTNGFTGRSRAPFPYPQTIPRAPDSRYLPERPRAIRRPSNAEVPRSRLPPQDYRAKPEPVRRQPQQPNPPKLGIRYASDLPRVVRQPPQREETRPVPLPMNSRARSRPVRRNAERPTAPERPAPYDYDQPEILRPVRRAPDNRCRRNGESCGTPVAPRTGRPKSRVEEWLDSQ